MARHGLTLHNRTNRNTNGCGFCLYQKVPDGCSPGIQSLAWLTKPLYHGCDLQFEWEESYAFQWAQTGRLLKGVLFIPSGTLPCEPGNPDRNAAELIREGGGYRLQRYGEHPRGNGLLIHSDKSIDSSLSVGISMSGRSVFAAQTNSNMLHLFVPHPIYFVTFGRFKEGCVLDEQRFEVDPFQIDFTRSCFMDVTLDENFKWHQRTMEQADAL